MRRTPMRRSCWDRPTTLRCWGRRIRARSNRILQRHGPGTSKLPSLARPTPNACLVNCATRHHRGECMRRLMGFVLVATMICLGAAARAEDTELDPAKVSEGLKAIFQVGSAETKKALNANTLTLISGTIGGTYVQFGDDLASVLDDNNDLRVLPIIGRGSVQSVADILFLQGVDLPNGGTFVTSLIVFERLGIKPNVVYIEQRIAMEKLRNGEIDAVIAVQGKPSKAISQFKDDRFHLVPVDYAKPLQNDYLPAILTAADYPNLISGQEQVDTIAVPAVLAAYNWPPATDRARKLSLFVDAFFTKFPTFQNPPFHPKWKEVSLATPLADWNRFPAAKQWLDEHKIEPVARVRFDEFLKQNPAAAKLPAEADKEALFKQFQAWEAEQKARAQVRAGQK